MMCFYQISSLPGIAETLLTDLWPLARRRPRPRLGLLAPAAARGPHRARTLLPPVAPVRVARAALTEDGLE